MRSNDQKRVIASTILEKIESMPQVTSTTPLRPLLVAIAIEKWKPPKPKCVLATKLHVALSIIWDRFPELRAYLPEPPHESKGP